MRFKRQLLYNAGQKIRGWTVFDKVKQLKEMESWSLEEIELYQLKKLKQLAWTAYENVPFYRELWGKSGVHPDCIKTLKDLSLFPKVTKKMLVEAEDLALNQKYRKKELVKGRSSGSTGERFVYYKSKEHHSWFIASALQSWTWTGWEMGNPWLRLQFRGKIGLHAKIEDWLFNCLYMPIDNLNEKFMEKFLNKAVKFQPELIRGYAGGTYVFAQYLLDRNEKRLRPKAVVTTGDTLYGHYRSTIEKAFECPVFDAYGGEGMSVANQCDQGAYHISPVVLVEIEHDKNNTKQNQPGRIVLTSLTNNAMPMIRYDIADIGIMGQDTCACGRKSKYLKKIIGRETDIVKTPAGNNLVCHHFNNVIREIDGIDQYQIIQNEIGSARLILAINSKYNSKKDEPNIISNLSKLSGKGFTIKMEYVESIPLPASGKRRYIISKIPN
jgi:phenylacetate-CoA ligase